MAGLPAYFLDNQGVHDAMLLPVIIKMNIPIAIPDFD
jgi:hypothetical protein